MENGWIKLHRKILDNPISKNANYFSLWITLLLLASHKESKFMWNGEIIIIKEGQLLTGRKSLSKESGIPESTIEDILKFLERQHQIRQQKTTKFRLITIINWKEYQKSDIKSDNKATTKQQQSDTFKNVKNDKNNICTPQSGDAGNNINKLFGVFIKVNPGINFGHKNQRESAKWLIDKYGIEKTLAFAEAAVVAQGKKYAPTITSPTHLKEKLGELNVYYSKESNKISTIIV